MVEATALDGLAAELLGNDDLLARIAAWKRTIEVAQQGLYLLEQEALARMERNGATSIPSEKWVCELVQRDTYDQAGLAPLKEIFGSADMLACFTPEHREIVVVPDKWETVTVKKLARKYGTESLAVVERARVEGRPRLKFSEKP